jgi:hypothetical protein
MPMFYTVKSVYGQMSLSENRAVQAEKNTKSDVDVRYQRIEDAKKPKVGHLAELFRLYSVRSEGKKRAPRK